MAIMKVEYTKYEIARILGARALQIAMNAPLLLDIPKEKLEELNYDPLKIAQMEFDEGVLPITVRRPMPQKAMIEGEDEEEVVIVEEDEKPKEAKVEEKAEAPELAEEESPEAEITEEI
jgi:DNA-directed RNA polymerase subunit K